MIKTKAGELIPLTLNKAQLRVHNLIKKMWQENKIIRIIVLKARQLGISTYIEAVLYALTSQLENHNAVIIADDKDGSNYIFEMSKLYQEKCPEYLRPDTKRSNEKKLEFDGTHSQILIDTAENKDAGRKFTFRLVHLSEYAFFKQQNADSIMLGLSHSVPPLGGTMIIKESTANGFNHFKDDWDAAVSGKTDEIPIFIPWYWGEEDQMPIDDTFAIGDPAFGDITADEPMLAKRMEEEGIDNIPQRLAWRRWDIRNNCKGDLDTFKQENPSCLIADTWVSHRGGIERIGMNKDRIVNGRAPVYKVKTKKGYVLHCTANHHIHNCTSYKPLNEFNIGDLVSLLPITFNKAKQTISAKYTFPCVKSKIIVDSDFARFIGLYMGDGCLTGKNMNYCLDISCDKKDTDVIDECDRLITKFFKKPHRHISKCSTGCVHVRVNNKYFKDFFYALDLVYQNSSCGFRRKVHVPDWIIKSPKNIVREFLRGIFEADGFVGYKTPRIVLFSKHEHFIRDIQMLLLGFGITSSIKIADKVNGVGHKYIGRELRLNCNETKLFMKEIGFISKRKNDRFKTFPKRSWNAKPVELKDQIVSIEDDGIHDVFNLTTDEHYYSANGIWTHNSPEEAFIASGQCFFDQKELVRQLDTSKEPLFKANIVKENFKWVLRKCEDGDFWFYEEPSPYGQYVIGGDACSGSGADYAPLVALNKESGNTVAVFHAKVDPDELAFRAMTLGNLLNEAKVAIENDKFGFAANQKLKTIYGNIYVQRTFNRVTNKYVEKFGWETNAITRPMMLSQMQGEIRNGTTGLRCAELIRECLTFIKNPQTKKAEAEQGKNDDLVIARAIAGQIRHDEPYRIKPEGRRPGIDITQEKRNAGLAFGKST